MQASYGYPSPPYAQMHCLTLKDFSQKVTCSRTRARVVRHDFARIPCTHKCIAALSKTNLPQDMVQNTSRHNVERVSCTTICTDALLHSQRLSSPNAGAPEHKQMLQATHAVVIHAKSPMQMLINVHFQTENCPISRTIERLAASIGLPM